MPLINLTWNTHYSSVFTLLSSFLNNETLVDVTLAAEGKFLKAHRIILCACSQFFQDLISNLDKDKQPVIFLHGVKFTHLQALLKFIYSGEIQLASEELPALLSVAQDLKIRGILDYHSDSHEASESGAASNHHVRGNVQDQAASTSNLSQSPSIVTISSKNLSSCGIPQNQVRRVLPLKRPKIGPKSKVRPPNPEPNPELTTSTLQNYSTNTTGNLKNCCGEELHDLDELDHHFGDAGVKVEVGGQGLFQIMESSTHTGFRTLEESHEWNADAADVPGMDAEDELETEVIADSTRSHAQQERQQDRSGASGRTPRKKSRRQEKKKKQVDPLYIASSSSAKSAAARRRRRPNSYRTRCPTRQMYTPAQKRNAVDLLEMGYSCRQVAELMGPGCSSGTPIRWRNELMGKLVRKKGKKAATATASNHSNVSNSLVV